METLRMKIAIGDRSFDAEGPPALVERQVDAFLTLTLGGSAETLAGARARDAQAQETHGSDPAPEAPGPELDRILVREPDGAVALRTRAASRSEAVLVLMLGQLRWRDLERVDATTLIAGMRGSGYRVTRVDGLLNTHADRDRVAIDGRRRNRRYRLTSAGVARAEAVAERLVSMSPARPDQEVVLRAMP